MPADTGVPIRHEEIFCADGRMELRVLAPSHDIATRQALVTVAAGLRGFGTGEGDIQTVQQVLAEVLNNVVEHAHAGDPSAVIELRVVVGDGTIHARVIDEGRPMPGGAIPDPALPHASRAIDLPEGGYGWCIIRAMAEKVSYVREGGRNILSVSLPARRTS